MGVIMERLRRSATAFAFTIATGLALRRACNGEYGSPLLGDYDIVTARAGSDAPELLSAGLFDENRKLPK
jgi:hypothetical protein